MSDTIRTTLSTEDSEWVYQRWPELRTTCPTCKTKFDDDGPRQFRYNGVDAECNCNRQSQLAKHYTLAGIGRTFQRLGWSDFHGDIDALHEVEHYLSKWSAYVDRGVGIIFTGSFGTGKTFLANMILKELTKRGVKCYATTFANTVESFTSTWGDRDQKQWFANRFMYSKVLLLDDLGRETRSSNNLPQTTFDMILRTRVQEARPTILTTNIAVNDLDVAGYGAAVLSLLKESSVVIDVKGSDFRSQRAGHTLDEIITGEVRPIT